MVDSRSRCIKPGSDQLRTKARPSKTNEGKMKNIWFISDTHFNHEGILGFKDYIGKPVLVLFQNPTPKANYKKFTTN